MKPDILVAAPLRPGQMALLEANYTLHRLDLVKGAERDALIADAGTRCTALVCAGQIVVDAAFLDRLPALRLVATATVGYDTMDLAEMTRRGVALTNTPDVLTDDVADTAVMLLLAARRKLLQGDRHVRSGDWGRVGAMPLTRTLTGRRAGIVGLGRIGGAIARRCEALGLEIGYCGRGRKPDVAYLHFDDPLSLATWADILIVATSGGEATRALVSGPVIDAIGPDGTLVNIGRGTVVEEPALIAALQEGRLGSAGLDVFLNEPHPDPALAALENVVLYPHHASGTEETRDLMSQIVIDNLAAFFGGRPLLTKVA